MHWYLFLIFLLLTCGWYPLYYVFSAYCYAACHCYYSYMYPPLLHCHDSLSHFLELVCHSSLESHSKGLLSFVYLVPKVLCGCYRCCFDVFSVSGDYSACLLRFQSCNIYWCGYDDLFQPLFHWSIIHHLPGEWLMYTLLRKNHNFWKFHSSYHFFCLVTNAS